MDKGNISIGLESPGTLGKKPIIGILMFIIGSLIFIILAYSLVTKGILIQWDLPIAEYFHNLALITPVFIIDFMIAGYYVGLEGIIVIGIILGLYFLYKRHYRELVMVAVGFGGGAIIFEVLSAIFKRPRPFLLFDKIIWAGTPNIPGFPSGHTLSAVVCFGFLIYLFVPKIKSYLGKTIVITLGLIIIIYIGISRLYIDDHFLTDVIAGYALGIAWFGLAYTSIELLFKKSSDRFFKPQKSSEKFLMFKKSSERKEKNKELHISK